MLTTWRKPHPRRRLAWHQLWMSLSSSSPSASTPFSKAWLLACNRPSRECGRWQRQLQSTRSVAVYACLACSAALFILLDGHASESPSPLLTYFVQFFEGMALGVTLRAQDPDRRPLNYLAYSICASVVAPIGIVIGIIVNETASETARLYATGIGYGCAGGVFLFIGLSHLINKGMRASPGDEWWKPFLKWGVSGVGFAINACLMRW